MRATSLVLKGVCQILFVLNICAYIPNLHTTIFYVLITVTVILCTNGSISNFVYQIPDDICAIENNYS